MLAVMPPFYHPMFDPIESILGTKIAHCAQQRCLRESDSEYSLVISAPGVRAQDINVTIDDGMLKAAGKTGQHTTFTSCVLPRDADAETVSASCVDGLLMVTIAKRAPAEPTTIAVHTTPQEEGSSSSEPHYTISLAAAGLAAADLNIQVDENGVLTVRGETTRTGARVDRSYRLPADAQGELTHATHVDGVTRLIVPKAAPVKTVIPVASGNANSQEEEALDGEEPSMM